MMLALGRLPCNVVIGSFASNYVLQRYNRRSCCDLSAKLQINGCASAEHLLNLTSLSMLSSNLDEADALWLYVLVAVC